MKTSRGMFVLGLVLGLLSWGSYVSLRADIGAWCYLPTVLFGALAALFLAAAAGRPVRRAAPFGRPALMVAALVSLPVYAADSPHREHGASLVADLLGKGVAFAALCWTLPSAWRHGRVNQLSALAEVAATEADEPEGE